MKTINSLRSINTINNNNNIKCNHRLCHSHIHTTMNNHNITKIVTTTTISKFLNTSKDIMVQHHNKNTYIEVQNGTHSCGGTSLVKTVRPKTVNLFIGTNLVNNQCMKCTLQDTECNTNNNKCICISHLKFMFNSLQPTTITLSNWGLSMRTEINRQWNHPLELCQSTKRRQLMSTRNCMIWNKQVQTWPPQKSKLFLTIPTTILRNHLYQRLT